jgi:Kef-type K+ transport system membrane component KefB
MPPTFAAYLPPLSAAAGGLAERTMLLALELAAILLVAKIAGEIFERALKLPAVLGELLAGMAIGPYALGGIPLPGLGGPLFPPEPPGNPLPVSPELWAIAQIASIVLLFVVGLETDFRMFLRYSLPGLLVGMGGVVGAFFLGAWLAVAMGHAPSFMHPEALFLGTISVATSVGITARILSEKRTLDSPEGTTILAAAVIDDVLGIIVLAIVGGIAAAEAAAGGAHAIDWAAIGAVAGRAVGFWLGATVLFALSARTIARGLGLFATPRTAPVLALGVALFAAGAAERAGLAMIIGAYIAGLALSKERIAKDLVDGLLPVYALLVPIFFCVMGMVVDFRASKEALGFGVIYTLAAIAGKIVGCGAPTFLVGFNLYGALRIGIGMLPRGEVALIIAGAAIAHDPPYIGQATFGVAILMTVVTTLLAPPLLVRSFARGGPGLRVQAEKRPTAERPTEGGLTIERLPGPALPLVRGAIVAAFEAEGFESAVVSTEPEIFRIVKGEAVIDVHAEDTRLVVDWTAAPADRVREIVAAGLARAREGLARAEIASL